MNWHPDVPWYRRLVIGDPFPNTTSWKVLEAEVRGAWLLVERHTRACQCSYCRGEHGHGFLWLPRERRYGWRVINFFHRLYVRWAPARR